MKEKITCKHCGSFEPSRVMTGLEKREAGFESKSDGINDKKSNGVLKEQINLKGELS